MLHPELDGALDDSFLCARIAEIVRNVGLVNIVETGVNAGKSTVEFMKMASWVFGVDKDGDCLKCAGDRMREIGNNYTLWRGNSPNVLGDIVTWIDCSKTLFFLDAHWEAYWPLLDEIAVIPRGKGVIVIHDALVPGTNLGYDSFGGVACSYEYVKESLDRWSLEHIVEYNSEDKAEKPNRGVLFAFPDSETVRRSRVAL